MTNLKNILDQWKQLPQSGKTMPTMFVGHGSPMNAIEENNITKNWHTIGENIGIPHAILCISAHWITPGTTQITTNLELKTIYDFYGFPQELYNQNYDVKGDPYLAKQIQELVKTTEIIGSKEWGIDHGSWSILMQMFPQKNIPVIQLSIDYDKPFSFHFELAKELRELRKKGILIIGSGNLVHNLREIVWDNSKVYGWNKEFDTKATSYIQERNFEALTKKESFGKIFDLAHPTYDHYLPVLYFAGLVGAQDVIHSFNEQFEMGSLSMRSFIAL